MEKVRKAIKKQKQRKERRMKLKKTMLIVAVITLIGLTTILMLTYEGLSDFEAHFHSVNLRHSNGVVINSTPPEAETLEFHHTITLRTTGYCSCEKCCGLSTGITCSGTQATPKRTIGANLNQFPIGTVIVINGIEYVVEDTGSAIQDNHVDVFYATHEEALQHGVQYVNAYVKGE